MNSRRLVLDTSVLSAFHAAGWFEALAFWHPEYIPTVSESVWYGEFDPHHGVDEPPGWLTVVGADLTRLDVRAMGQLGETDWTCVELADRYERTRLVTNDRAMKNVAEDRDVESAWGTEFAMETFERCGMTPSEFESGVPSYVDDVRLPDRVADELAATEKPDEDPGGS